MNSNQMVGAVMLLAGSIILGAGVIANAIGLGLKASVGGESGFVVGGLLGLVGLCRLLFEKPPPAQSSSQGQSQGNP